MWGGGEWGGEDVAEMSSLEQSKPEEEIQAQSLPRTAPFAV